MKPDNFGVMFSLSFLGHYTELGVLEEGIYFLLSLTVISLRLIMLQASKSILFRAAGWGMGENKDQICNDLGIKSLQKVSFGTMVKSY